MAKNNKKSSKRLSTADLLQEAISCHQSGELEKARYRYSKILQSEPDNASAMNFYGMLESQQGDIKLAERLLKRSVTLDPVYADAINNLGNCFKIQGKVEEAESAYQQAHKLTPNSTNPMINLGVLARSAGKLSDAQSWYHKALSIDPNSSIALTCLAGLQEAQGNQDEALQSYQKALEIDGSFGPLYANYAKLLARLDRKGDAVNLYEKQLLHDPDDATAHHMLSALSGENTPERASSDYVSDLFDRFANSFDQVLDRLEYKAPVLVGDLVREYYPNTNNTLDVLDAGCGTGLCGSHLRPVSRNVIGIDLSAEMLRHAELCNHYDSLVKSEIVEYLTSSRKLFDLIVSADTFCYFGDMAGASCAAFSVLKPGGRFMFTVELHEEDKPEYILQSHGRYSHNSDYIERCLTRAGFVVLTNKRVVLRKERGEPVNGILVCAGVE